MKISSMSAMVLAGGFSSRMGRSKAELELDGSSFTQLQVKKLRTIGIKDIMLSGYEADIPETRFIPDVYPHKGPLSGIHACLLAAEGSACLAIGVDVPLLQPETLAALAEAHTGGVTILVHGGKWEPLMAVYDCGLAGTAEAILQSEKTALMKLVRSAGMKELAYRGEELLLSNCNTPGDYEQLLRFAAEHPEYTRFMRE